VADHLGPPVESESGIGPLTLGGMLADVAARYADREAMVFHEPSGGERLCWRYRELAAGARLIARALLASGVGKGTRVAVLMGNRPEWVLCAFGVALAGGVLIPLNTYLEPPELRYVLRHSDTAFLLHQSKLAGHDFDAMLDRLWGGDPSEELPHLRLAACLGRSSWEQLMTSADGRDDRTLDAAADGVSPHDDALVIYTSGTTAQPKGVLHSHRPPCLQSWRFAAQLCLDETVRVWSAFPFFWTAGFCMVMGATLAAGGCLVLQEHFEPGEALHLLESERVTSPHAWPHQYAAMERHPDWARRDLSSFRHVDPATSFSRHPSVRVDGTWSPRAAFGLTETFTIVSSLPADTPLATRGASQGVILPGNVVRVVDPSTGEPRGVGEIGEIAVKGPTLMKGYLKVAPESCFDIDGFFRTGDAGFVDESSRLHWTGRMTDMIKTGGANVSPVEIEETLVFHPALSVARAVGIPHDTLGEMVVVCAVAKEGSRVDEEGVREFLRGQIASYKIPRRVLFFEESQLSLTGNAKVRPEELRAMAMAKIAGDDPPV
jgi:fatty-acyl-CoA synthase